MSRRNISDEEEEPTIRKKIIFQEGRSKLWTVSNYTPDLYEEMMKLPVVVEPAIYVFGKECHQKRNVGFFSDESKGYKYSGQSAKAIPLSNHPVLLDLMNKVNEDFGTEFNGVLVNVYKNGEKYISAHSDNEKGLSGNTVISIAYGAKRKFRVRRKEDKEIVVEHIHKPCQILAMEGPNFQKKFTHEIPIEKKVKECRISLTFRAHNE
jgi:alkylated DNA repair dioxygenase AlkB